jgi:hypothetical protein
VLGTSGDSPSIEARADQYITPVDAETQFSEVMILEQQENPLVGKETLLSFPIVLYHQSLAVRFMSIPSPKQDKGA